MPNVQRAALVNLGDLTAYDQAKTFLVVNGFDPDSKVFFYTRSNKNSILQEIRPIHQYIALMQILIHN